MRMKFAQAELFGLSWYWFRSWVNCSTILKTLRKRVALEMLKVLWMTG